MKAADADNQPPLFPDQDPDTEGYQTDQTRYVLESDPAPNRGVVSNEDGETAEPNDDPVTAADTLEEESATETEDDTLTYTLDGPDAGSFTINEMSGQISVGDGTKLDYETKDTYTVTVTATDPTLASDTITVTIKVVDVDEEPVVSKSGLGITGETSIDYDEDETSDVATYMAAGQAAPGARWSLEGDDAGDFSISSGGVLTFRATPNFENPTDQGANNVYNVMVKATSGAIDATLAVTVTVGNEEEDGTVTLSPPAQATVGDTLTASLTDLDGGVTGTTWQWARSSDGSTGWDRHCGRHVVVLHNRGRRRGQLPASDGQLHGRGRPGQERGSGNGRRSPGPHHRHHRRQWGRNPVGDAAHNGRRADRQPHRP